MHKAIVTTSLMVLLAGCSVGPNYQPPAIPAPESFGSAPVEDQAALDQQRFWQGFGDPLLAQLIQQTLTANYSLHIALARYERAAALLYGAKRELWPSVTMSGAVAEDYLAEVERFPPGAESRRVQIYQADLAATWELDLFGRLRQLRDSHSAELQAAAADLAAVQVALTGQLASSYFELRGLQQQLLVAQQNVALQEQSLDIVTARLNVGRGSDFDRVRAQAQLARTRASVPLIEAGIRTAMHRIAVLTGQPPTALINTLSPRVELPETLPAIPLDSPGDVLRRRPDLIAAERRLAAASMRIGVASADLFPRFTLGALIGSLATDADDLFTGPAESRRVALGIDWSFLDHDRVRARIEAADAESRAALAGYQHAILEAIEETENRLVRLQRSRERADQLELAQADAKQAVDLARTRYEQGFIGYFEVLAAEQELSVIQAAAVDSRTAVSLAMVDLYRALVGAPAASS